MLDDCASLAADGDGEAQQTPTPSFCLGFIHALLHINLDVLPKEERQFCPPRAITAGEAAQAMVQTLRDSASLQSMSYNAAALLALRSAYPCPTGVG